MADDVPPPPPPRRKAVAADLVVRALFDHEVRYLRGCDQANETLLTSPAPGLRVAASSGQGRERAVCHGRRHLARRSLRSGQQLVALPHGARRRAGPGQPRCVCSARADARRCRPWLMRFNCFAVCSHGAVAVDETPLEHPLHEAAKRGRHMWWSAYATELHC